MRKFYNITEDDKKLVKNKLVYCLVIYDISDNKRRRNLIKILNQFGNRVQKSAFDSYLTVSKYKLLQDRLDGFYRQELNDQIRLYRLGVKQELIIWGDEILAENDDLVFL